MNFFALGVLTTAMYGFCYYQNNWLQVTRLNINKDIDINDDMRILQLSDLHSKEFGRDNKVLLKAIYKERPDMIVATGDLIDSTMKKMDEIIDFFAEIHKYIPVFYIPGNNEVRCDKLDEILLKLKEAGINVLNNEISTIELKGTRVNVLGLVEHRVGEGELFYEKAKSRYESNKSEKLFNRLEVMDGLKIVLSHYPENFELNEDMSYCRHKFDIMFSGHAHGGQFRLPFIGGVFAPGQGIFPKYYSGMYGDKNKLIVSRGLGNSGFPLRLFNRPNIVVVNIISQLEKN